MKTLQDLTVEDFENCIDNVTTDFNINMPIALFINSTQNLAIEDFTNFVNNYIQFLSSVSNGTVEQVTNFANTVYENINNLLL